MFVLGELHLKTYPCLIHPYSINFLAGQQCSIAAKLAVGKVDSQLQSEDLTIGCVRMNLPSFGLLEGSAAKVRCRFNGLLSPNRLQEKGSLQAKDKGNRPKNQSSSFFYTKNKRHPFQIIMRRKAVTTITREDHASQHLLQFLEDRFPYFGQKEWREQINNARVLVNHQPALTTTSLRLGDVVAFICHDLPEPAVDLSCEVIYEDPDILVVNKPANLPCHPKGRYFRHTLWALLKKNAENRYLSFVNRIDRETSGIVLMAKNKKAARNCQQQFIERRVEKSYLAIVNGTFPSKISCRGLLSKDLTSSIRHKVRFIAMGEESVDATRGKMAHTEFQLLRRIGRFSLVAARLHTGRRHQIRATLAALNFPLLGDKLYASDEKLFHRFTMDSLTDSDKKYLGLERQALHASQLSFYHPHDGREMSIHAPLPADMQNFLMKSLPQGRRRYY